MDFEEKIEGLWTGYSSSGLHPCFSQLARGITALNEESKRLFPDYLLKFRWIRQVYKINNRY